MPSRPRRHSGQFVFHVYNRAIQNLVLFERSPDYDAFLDILRQAAERHHMRLLVYAVMPNHWHLVVWPCDDTSLSLFMQRLTVTHAKRWREFRGSTGRGAVYQGRFKAVPIQQDGHLLRACLYVERNPPRGRLVARAEDWPWSSASPLALREGRPALTAWPVAKPADWPERLNLPEPAKALEEIRKAIARGVPFGSAGWAAVAMRRLPWTIHGQPTGRRSSNPFHRREQVPLTIP